MSMAKGVNNGSASAAASEHERSNLFTSLNGTHDRYLKDTV
jgi:hypothetical protein